MKVRARLIRNGLAALVLASFVGGCRIADSEALATRQALLTGRVDDAVRWSESLAQESSYSKNLGLVEAGRVRMLSGDWRTAESWFRQAVESAVNRNESQPVIKLGDVGNTLLSSTITDDRTQNYYLAPYELNLALEYGILAQVMNGRLDDALVDSRLAVYVQDSLATTYGADVVQKVKGSDAKANGAADTIYAAQSASLQEMMVETRNSWENPTLWWLTGVLFEADGDFEMAWQSYRKAAAVRSDNPVFVADAARADSNLRTPAADMAKLVVIYEEGWVPLRESLKIPVPIYTGMAIDLPMYEEKAAYRPNTVSISGAEKLVSAHPALNIRSLAARDLDEHLPGVILRNITRAAVQAGAQAAVNAAGNDYAQIAMFVGNAVISAMRRADTRCWVTLPDGQQVWSDGAMSPGDYQLGISVNGRTVTVPVSLAAGKTSVLWIADDGMNFKTATARLEKGNRR